MTTADAPPPSRSSTSAATACFRSRPSRTTVTAPSRPASTRRRNRAFPRPNSGHFKKSRLRAQAVHPRVPARGRRDAGRGSRARALTIFKQGQLIDVIGHSKGKGFQGIMRKHNADGQPASHGSMMHRRPGAIGMPFHPGPHLEEPEHARSHGRRAGHRPESSHRAGARDRQRPAGRRRRSRSRRRLRHRSPGHQAPVGTIAKVRSGQASVAKTGAKTAVKKK